MKKTIVCVLVMMLVIQTLSMSALMRKAHAMSGSGTPAAPYMVMSPQDLSDIRNDLSANYILGADIDLAGYDYDGAGLDVGGWMPIGNDITPFTGTLNGNGYAIRNLTISRPSMMSVGLFGRTGTNAQLLSIRLLDINVTGSTRVGGLMGTNDGTIQNSYATGSVSAPNSTAGGLVGYVRFGTILNSYAVVNVSGWDRLGGLVGTNDGTIQNSYAAGNVNGHSEVGGLVGYNSSGTIQNSYAVGNVSGNSLVGGLVGRQDGSTITTNSFWNTQTSGQSTSAAGTGKTTAQLKMQSAFTGWDFSGVWGIREGETYPYLLAFKPKIVAGPLLVTEYNLSPGQDQLSVTGTVYDDSIGEQVTIDYAIKNSSNVTVASVTYSVYADGSAQSIGRTIPLAGLGNGTYTLNITATDTYNTAVAAAPIAFTVNDSNPPSVSFGTNGNEIWADSAATTVTVSDSLSGVNASTLQYAWTTDTAIPTSGWTSFASGGTLTKSGTDGDWYLHIQAQDAVANTVNAVSNRFRLDNTAPVIALNGPSSMHLTVGSAYTELATATDIGSGAGSVVVTGTVNTNVPGTYTFRYNVSDLAGNPAAEVTRTVIVDAASLPPTSTSGGGGSTPVVTKPVIDQNGVSLDLATIDTTKPSVTLEVTPKDGVAYVSIPASILTSIEGKNATFFIEIKTPYGSYQVPVNLASLIPGLEDLLSASNLKAEDISFKITLTDKSGNKDIQAAFANGLPNGNVMGTIVDFSIEIINSITGQSIGTADKFSKALTRVIPMPKNMSGMPEQWGAFRYNETTKKFEFVAAKKSQIDGIWYVMINSYSNSVYVVAENTVDFADVQKHWSQPFIELAAAKGLVEGVGGGNYAPDQSVTRAEFTAMLVRALGRGTASSQAAPYDDVKPGAWYSGVVAKVKELGLLDFANGSSFQPDRLITREEMASMLAAVIALEQPAMTQDAASVNGFKDIGSVNAMYLEDVRLVVKLQLMNGTSATTFSPMGITTRAQAATVLVRTLQTLGMMDR